MEILFETDPEDGVANYLTNRMPDFRFTWIFILEFLLNFMSSKFSLRHLKTLLMLPEIELDDLKILYTAGTFCTVHSRTFSCVSFFYL